MQPLTRARTFAAALCATAVIVVSPALAVALDPESPEATPSLEAGTPTAEPDLTEGPGDPEPDAPAASAAPSPTAEEDPSAPSEPSATPEASPSAAPSVSPESEQAPAEVVEPTEPSATAEEVATGSISGSVSFADGSRADATQIRVLLFHYDPSDYEPDGSDWDRAGGTSVAADGSYTLPNLQPGRYWVCFRQAEYGGRWQTECWDGVHTEIYDSYFGTFPQGATEVVLADGQARNGIDVEMDRTPSIEGTLSDQAGTPLDGTSVLLYEPGTNGEWRLARNTVTADGAWSFLSLAAGTYRVCFDVFPRECYDESPSVDTATNLTVDSAPVVIHEQVSPGTATLTGTVASDAGSAVRDAEVVVYTRLGDGFYNEARSLTTDRNGAFATDLAGVGEYIVCVSLDGFHPECWGEDERGNPTPISGSHELDFVIDRVSSISGQVTLPAGAEPEPVRLVATDGTLTGVTAHPDTRGTYRFDALRAGTYYVCVLPNIWFDEAPWLQDTCWDGAAVSTTGDSSTHVVGLESARTVTVAPGESADVDLSVATVDPLQLTGTVVAQGGAPAAGEQVGLFKRTSYGNFNSAETVTTGTDGTFAFEVYDGRTYRVCTTDLDHCWENATRLEAATDITIDGQAVSGIDIALVPPVTTTVSGVVSDAAGAGLPGVVARLYQPGLFGGWDVVSETETSTGNPGAYSFDDVLPGTYRLCFEAWTAGGAVMASECHDEATTVSDATDVVVGTEPVTVDEDLAVGFAQLTGATKSPSGAPIGGALVRVYYLSDDGWWVPEAPLWTAADGTFAMTVDGTRAYRVCAAATGYYSECWQDAAEVETAMSLSGAQHLEFTLATGGYITGTVSLPAGTNTTDALVLAIYDSSFRHILNAYRDPASGSYRTSTLAPGTYYVCFFPDYFEPSGLHLHDTCWADVTVSRDDTTGEVTGLRAATPITVSAGQGTTVDLTATSTGTDPDPEPEGGSLSGTVKRGSGATVTLWRQAADDSWSVADEVTAEGRTFAFDDLAPGTYQVCASTARKESDCTIGGPGAEGVVEVVAGETAEVTLTLRKTRG